MDDELHVKKIGLSPNGNYVKVYWSDGSSVLLNPKTEDVTPKGIEALRKSKMLASNESGMAAKSLAEELSVPFVGAGQ